MKKIVVILWLLAGLAVFTQAHADTIPEFRAANQSRLFIAPTGRVLPSGVIMMTVGGGFASVEGGAFLGLVAVGMGGFAEIEMSTAQLLSNIFLSSETIGTTALKFRLYQFDNSMKPSIGLALRTNAWAQTTRNQSDLTGPALEENGGVRMYSDLNLETHLTTLTLSSSADFTPKFSGHIGIVWSEVRVRNVSYWDYYNNGSSLKQSKEEIQKAMLGGSLGIEYSMNPHSHLIIEGGTLPQLQFDKDIARIDSIPLKMEIKPLYYGMAGLRFFFTPTTSVDAAIRYRSDYTGLSDAEIRAGFNFGIDLAGTVKNRRFTF